jgi:hypothetical protein
MSEQNIPRMPETILERDLGVMISNDMKREKTYRNDCSESK